jgi:hypothetical protein
VSSTSRAFRPANAERDFLPLLASHDYARPVLNPSSAPARTKLAQETGITVTRAGLYKALSPAGNPSFETVSKIVGAFGMRLSARAA